MDIFVREAAASAARDRSLLVDAVARVAGVEPGLVQLRTRCARCGSADHGKPAVASPLGAGGAPFHASLSRSGRFTVVGVSTDAPLGVDIERVADVERASMDAALHPGELRDLAGLGHSERAYRVAVLWTAKEAVLKAAGVGLNVDPSAVRLRVRDLTVELVGWPPAVDLPAATTIGRFELPGGFVGAVAVLGGTSGAGVPRVVSLA